MISSPALSVPRCDSASPRYSHGAWRQLVSGLTSTRSLTLSFPASIFPLGDTRRPTRSRDAMRSGAGRRHCRSIVRAKSHHPRDLFLEPPHNLGAHDSNRHKAGFTQSFHPALTGAAVATQVASLLDAPLPYPSLQADYVTSHRHFFSSVRRELFGDFARAA